LATGDEKQDEFERLLGTQQNSAAPKPPGAFTRFFELETGTKSASSYPPPPARGNLNDDALPVDTDSATRPAHLNVHDALPPSPSAAWNDAAISPSNSAIPQPGTFEGLFHRENSIEPVQSSTSGFGQDFGSAGLLSLGGSDRVIRSANDGAELPSESLGAGPIGLPEPHSRQDGQKATHLFSLGKAAEPAVPLQGPSAYTRVINSSAQRAADEEKAGVSKLPPNAPSPAPAPVLPPVPVVAPQWPNPQMYPLPYSPPATPQASMPLHASMPSLPAGVLPAPQPPGPIQAATQTPQPTWITYMPLIIGLNVLLFLTAIFVLIFALLPK
jgi:hypothetical protein